MKIIKYCINLSLVIEIKRCSLRRCEWFNGEGNIRNIWNHFFFQFVKKTLGITTLLSKVNTINCI